MTETTWKSVEGHLLPAPGHMCIEIPPNLVASEVSVAQHCAPVRRSIRSRG
ncbi:MAG TPA: hypothetical protein VKK81_06310 [Candidatus Binatia bacterium]|nr:hypothetical protein [Candidatus Binatia bacterium]